MHLIHIAKNTSVDDINRDWRKSDDGKVIFQISSKSSFQMFAEGIALGFLRDLVLSKSHVTIRLYQAPSYNQKNEFEGVYPILRSIFGLELLRICQSLEDRTSSTLEIRDSLGKLVWVHAKDNGGVISDGKRVYLISRHGYEVPRCLREDPSNASFPRFDYFQSNIASYVLGIRGREVGHAEKRLIEWLHQIAENAHEHGGLYGGEEYSVQGFRGIILGKLIVRRTEDIDKRHDIPGSVKAYIRKQLSVDKSSKNSFILNVATVIDLGEGIHSTVPENKKGQSSFESLNKAFEDGVTRKNIKMHEKSGYGLAQAVNAAVHLGALLHVASGGLEALLDLSDKSNAPASNEGKIVLKKCADLTKQSGSSVSIAWMTKR